MRHDRSPGHTCPDRQIPPSFPRLHAVPPSSIFPCPKNAQTNESSKLEVIFGLPAFSPGDAPPLLVPRPSSRPRTSKAGRGQSNTRVFALPVLNVSTRRGECAPLPPRAADSLPGPPNLPHAALVPYCILRPLRHARPRPPRAPAPRRCAARRGCARLPLPRILPGKPRLRSTPAARSRPCGFRPHRRCRATLARQLFNLLPTVRPTNPNRPSSKPQPPT